MSAPPLLRTLFQYHAWANDELLDRMASLDPEQHRNARHAAIRVVNHAHVVNRIFAGHLTGTPHGFTDDNTPETPALADLRAAVAESDRWYLAYLDTLTPALLAESVPFVFTDGDKGRMTREEMLAHVVTHNGYHRGEAGRLLAQCAVHPPRDTLAVHLHRSEPARRERG